MPPKIYADIICFHTVILTDFNCMDHSIIWSLKDASLTDHHVLKGWFVCSRPLETSVFKIYGQELMVLRISQLLQELHFYLDTMT